MNSDIGYGENRDAPAEDAPAEDAPAEDAPAEELKRPPRGWDFLDSLESAILVPLQKFLEATEGAPFSMVLVGLGTVLASASIWGRIVYGSSWGIAEFLGLLTAGVFVIVLGFADRVFTVRTAARSTQKAIDLSAARVVEVDYRKSNQAIEKGATHTEKSDPMGDV